MYIIPREEFTGVYEVPLLSVNISHPHLAKVYIERFPVRVLNSNLPKNGN